MSFAFFLPLVPLHILLPNLLIPPTPRVADDVAAVVVSRCDFALHTAIFPALTVVLCCSVCIEDIEVGTYFVPFFYHTEINCEP